MKKVANATNYLNMETKELFKIYSKEKDKEIREIIRKRYKESLKDEVVERLNTVIKAIKEDNLEEIIPFIGDSPSGDDYGCDNRYISFKDVTDCEDIGDVIDALMEK